MAPWLCYDSAIQNGVDSVVVPIGKLSVVVSVAFSRLAFKEKLSGNASCRKSGYCGRSGNLLVDP